MGVTFMDLKPIHFVWLFLIPGALFFFWGARLCSLKVARLIAWCISGLSFLMVLLILLFGPASGMGAAFVLLLYGSAGCACIILIVLSYLLKPIGSWLTHTSPESSRVFTTSLNLGGICLLLNALLSLLFARFDLMGTAIFVTGVGVLVFHAFAFIVYVREKFLWLIYRNARLKK